MPVLLEDSQVDLEAEALDAVMSDTEVSEATSRLHAPPRQVEDIRDGSRGNRVSRGRAVARRAWRYDGTESLLPIAWNPEGTRNDGGRSYMSKKHCLCCTTSGFRGGVCIRCIRSNCVGCRAGTDKTKIIRLYYLSKDQVPFPLKFHGDIDCFLPSCPRKNGMGFKTGEEMRMHAGKRHRMEYAARQEEAAAVKSDEVAELRRQLDDLKNLMLQGPQGPQWGEISPPVAQTKSGPGRRTWTAAQRREASLKAKARLAASSKT